MPLGITDAPAQFMNMVNDLLGEYLDKCTLVFLDDVLIYSSNPQDHANTSRKYCEISGSISYMLKQANVKFQDIRSVPWTANLQRWNDSDRGKVEGRPSLATLEDVKGVRSFLGFKNITKDSSRILQQSRTPLCHWQGRMWSGSGSPINGVPFRN